VHTSSAGVADKAFSGGRTEHLLRARWLISLFRPGIYDNHPLADLADHYVTLDLIHAVARGASRGRLLEVATTDLDKEETVVWDMGAIAARGDEAARRLFRDVLLASASVPAGAQPQMRQPPECPRDGSAPTPREPAEGAMQVPNR
jgi:hypothetical protein